MRKLRLALCLAGLVSLVPLIICAGRVLPMDRRPLVAEKYAGWSGVLRLWVFEGWPCGAGSLSTWLNRCVAGFEKAHPGVYVQPQYVDAEALAHFNDSGILPPDMLLFPPGLLDSPEGLIALSDSGPVRPPLSGSGRWGDALYALPVAMGGYMWAWNAALVNGIPIDWRDCASAPAAPTPERWRGWDAALLSLCAGGIDSGEEESEARDSTLPGLDLGLPAESASAPAATPAPSAPRVPRVLPEGFDFSESAWRDFINGQAAAIPVTQREVARLEALSGQGKGPDWRLSVGDEVFSDQLLFLSVVQREDAQEQRRLCLRFLSWLLEDTCQQALSGVAAFSVTDAPSGYAPGDPLAPLDVALRESGLVTVGCFDGQWRQRVSGIVRKWVEGNSLSTESWRSFRAALAKYPNI